MKKIFVLFFLMSGVAYGQLSKVPMGVGTKLNVAFPIINLAIDQINTNTAAIALKAPINNASFTGLTTLESLKVSAGGGTITSITIAGGAIHFWDGVTDLTTNGGAGSGIWGTISGALANQIDLANALALKADLNNPAFTGTPTGITAAHVGAMSTSHAANAITGANITNWNTAYGWGNHASAGYALTTALSGYVPITTTVNGHALSSNVSVTLSDLGITASLAELNVLYGIPAGLTATEIGYSDGVTSSIQSQLNNTISGSAIYPELADTIPLFAFGYGQGKAIDTTGIDMTSDFGGFFNDGSDSMIIAKVIGIVKNSKNASNIYVNVYYGTTYFTAIDSVLTNPLNIVSTTTGTSSTTFHSKKIPPQRWVWVKTANSLGTTGTIPSKLRGTVSGYKSPKY